MDSPVVYKIYPDNIMPNALHERSQGHSYGVVADMTEMLGFVGVGR
jgi:hypothetical protein